MCELFYYYIQENAEKKGENDLPAGPRIYRTSRQYEFTNTDNKLHGPFKSLRGMDSIISRLIRPRLNALR